MMEFTTMLLTSIYIFPVDLIMIWIYTSERQSIYLFNGFMRVYQIYDMN